MKQPAAAQGLVLHDGAIFEAQGARTRTAAHGGGHEVRPEEITALKAFLTA